MKGKSRASKIIELEKLVQKYQKQVDNKPPEQDMRPLKEQIVSLSCFPPSSRPNRKLIHNFALALADGNEGSEAAVIQRN